MVSIKGPLDIKFIYPYLYVNGICIYYIYLIIYIYINIKYI